MISVSCVLSLAVCWDINAAAAKPMPAIISRTTMITGVIDLLGLDGSEAGVSTGVRDGAGSSI